MRLSVLPPQIHNNTLNVPAKHALKINAFFCPFSPVSLVKTCKSLTLSLYGARLSHRTPVYGASHLLIAMVEVTKMKNVSNN